MRHATLVLTLFAVLCVAAGHAASAGELHKAARKGDADVVATLIASGADVGERDNVVGAPLHWAAARGHLDVAEALLQAGADIDQPGNPPDNLTPLHLAASSGRRQMVEWLVASGADMAAGTDAGGTPLHWAARNNHAAIVGDLIAAGADANALASAPYGITPLHWAAEAGATDALDVLIRAGVPVDAANRNGSTALHLAVLYSHVVTARRLLEAGADAWAVSTNLTTPVRTAGETPEMKALFAEFGHAMP